MMEYYTPIGGKIQLPINVNFHFFNKSLEASILPFFLKKKAVINK
jgi:hypothetical protein